jgi:putative acetyltransferase
MSEKAQAEILVRPVDPMDCRVRALIDALDAYESALYPDEFNELVAPETFLQPAYLLLGAFREDAVVGIGGLREIGNGCCEIKRMYVSPHERGQGIATLLIHSLEAHCLERDCRNIFLETGVSQKAAIGLYERHGYERCGPFGAYHENPYSVFFKKVLSSVDLDE